MNPILSLLASSLLALLLPTSVNAGETIEEQWLRLIAEEVSSSCRVGAPDVLDSLTGNNGARVEHWRLATCSGPVEYEVSYWPPEYFPGRASPITISRVMPGKGPPANKGK